MSWCRHVGFHGGGTRSGVTAGSPVTCRHVDRSDGLHGAEGVRVRRPSVAWAMLACRHVDTSMMFAQRRGDAEVSCCLDAIAADIPAYCRSTCRHVDSDDVSRGGAETRRGRARSGRDATNRCARVIAFRATIPKGRMCSRVGATIAAPPSPHPGERRGPVGKGRWIARDAAPPDLDKDDTSAKVAVPRHAATPAKAGVQCPAGRRLAL